MIAGDSPFRAEILVNRISTLTEINNLLMALLILNDPFEWYQEHGQGD